ncbi:MAG: hypothetical protein HYY64_12290 [Candidatus Rokubacteria bacterium]|nr:hypothetical protein [Candidatus Rokubacteria bacterium]
MTILMRVYYDNVIASGLITGDIAPEAEMAALRELERAHAAGTIKRVTSRESWAEQERTRDAVRRSQLEAARDLVVSEAPMHGISCTPPRAIVTGSSRSTKTFSIDGCCLRDDALPFES